MGVRLVLVPHTGWLTELDVCVESGVLNLDNLIMDGLSGLYFRRKRFQAALHPGLRTEYDKERHEYLRAVLPELNLPGGTVVLGTHPTDVDLMEYDQVSAVRFPDEAMRGLSKSVYGDVLMLGIEYVSVLHAVEQAVDVWHAVVQWKELPMMLLREYPDIVAANSSVSMSTQRRVLSDILAERKDAAVWLEDDLRLNIPMRRSFLIADYDYLLVMRPRWRDAVVRVMGSAPPIVDVLKLPWFVIDPSVMHELCLRNGAHGMPLASTSGQSLVEFVRTRLASVFTTRELIGTWVAGVLSDDCVAVDTLAYLDKRPITAVGVSSPRSDVRDGVAVHVPPEYEWMYSAVPDVRVVSWTGPRRIDGSLRIDGDAGTMWASTLFLASQYARLDALDPIMAAEVVQFFGRLHAGGVNARLLSELNVHVADVLNADDVLQVFDNALTPMLPGYNYLYCFVNSVRRNACDVLGSLPDMTAVLTYGRTHSTVDVSFSVDALCAELSRSMIFAGRPLQKQGHRMSVGATSDTDGYCYLSLFPETHRAAMSTELGAYPALAAVVDPTRRELFAHGSLDRVFVSYTRVARLWFRLEGVLHFTEEPTPVTVRQLLDALQYCGERDPYELLCARVGGIPTQHSTAFTVLAIVGWTLDGVFALAVAIYVFMHRNRGTGAGHRAQGLYR